MAFIAECSFCRVKLQGVPDHRAGSSTECPRCHNLFTLAPMVNPPRLRPATHKAPDKAASTTTAAVANPPAPAAILVAPHPPIRTTKPPVTSVAGKRTGGHPPPVAPLLAVADWEMPPARPPKNIPFGIVAFVCGSVALLTASLPYLGVVTIPLSGLGLFLGVLGLRAAAAKRGGPAFPSAGLAVSLPVLVLALFWPGLLGREDSAAGSAAADFGLVMRPVGDPGPGDRVVAGQADRWIDASQSGVQNGDVRLRVTAAAMQPVQIKGRKPGREKLLVLSLRLENVGALRQLDYASWGETGPTLADNAGRTYRLRTFPGADVVGHVRRAALGPGKVVEDVLVFEPPAPSISCLHLELPAAAVGGEGAFRLEIPWDMIKHK